MTVDLNQARALLPMPQLLAKLGLGAHAHAKAHCLFHEDKTPSAGICEKDGRWHYVCHAGCGSFDEVDLLAKYRSLTKGEAIKQYAELAGLKNGSEPAPKTSIEKLAANAAEIFGGKLVAPATLPLNPEQMEKLAKWRGYSLPFIQSLSDRDLISIFTDHEGERCVAFPVTGGIHYRKKDGTWRYSPGAKAELFVLGTIEEGAHVHCFESQWDALAYADASGELNNVVATRGAGNAKLVAQRLTGHTGSLYLWPQNDEPGQKWARDIRELLPDAQIKLAAIPPEHKDLNAWRKSGATDGAVFNAFLEAKDFYLDTTEPKVGMTDGLTGGRIVHVTPPPTIFPVPVLAEPLLVTRGKARESTPQKADVSDATTVAETRGGENTSSGRETVTSAPETGHSRSPLDETKSATAQGHSPAENGGDHQLQVQVLPARPLSLILDQIGAFLRRYMRFEEEWQPDLCSLWAAYTWTFKSFARTPYLYIFSPEANCGKTQLMNCLYYLSPPEPRRWSIVAPSEASLFRKIHKDTPVIFVDEIDVYFAKGYDDPIVGILNAGYKIGSRVPRCIGRSGELEEFEVFCPKCFTGIGKLPSTTASRSIHIRLTRQASDDMAQSFRELEIPNEVKEITSFLSDWAKANAKTLQEARPEIPDEIKDGRKIEIIEPLLAIADLAGSEWAERARHAAVSAFNQNLETKSENIKLLASMRSLFLTKSAPRLTTEEILTGLVSMEDADAPWPTWWEKDLAQNPPRTRGPAMKLAKMLQSFGIHPRTIRPNYEDKPSKGYVEADFELAWKRYLPSEVKLEPMELGL